MKKTITLLVMSVATMAAFAQEKEASKTVENPVIRFSNTSTIDVAAITTDMDATILDIHAQFIPGWWIKIASDSYIEADGMKYKMKKAEGITPDAEFWMPESGEADFRLYFESVPESVTCIDFVEGDKPDAFRLFGIDLTGSADPYSISNEVPKNLTDIRPGFANVAPIFDVADTRINVHVTDFKPGMNPKYNVYLNTVAGTKEIGAINLDDDGNASCDFILYGTSYVMLVPDSYSESCCFMLAPGEVLDIYIDGNGFGRQHMARRKESDHLYPGLLSVPYLYYSGIYAPSERAMDKATREFPLFDEMIYSFEINRYPDFSYDMTTEEYVEKLLGIYRKYLETVSSSNQEEDAKAFLIACIQTKILYALADADYNMMKLYWNMVGSDYGKPIPEGTVRVKVSTDEWQKVLKAIGDIDYSYLVPIILRSGMMIELFGMDNGFDRVFPEGSMLTRLHEYYGLMEKLEREGLTDTDMENGKGLDESFYSKALETRSKELDTLKEKYNMSSLVQPIPEGDGSEFFDAIVVPHSGKVVLVDIWNTWCGGCRQSISLIEPLKDTELNKDDIVWIYIADETSPLQTYLEVINGVRGLHYRLNPYQKEALWNRFDVKGIPFHILVDRDGNIEPRPDFLDPDQLKKTLIEKANGSDRRVMYDSVMFH